MNYLEEFLTYLLAEKRYSAHTIRAYRDDIGQFMNFCLGAQAEEKPHEARQYFDPSTVTADDLRQWIIYLHGTEHRQASSINRKISSVKAYHRFLRKKQVVETDLFRKVTNLKTPKRLPAFVEESRMKRIIHTLIHETNDFITERDTLILLMFYATGIRLAELTNIRIPDFSPDYLQLKIRGKGDKERVVPVMPLVKRKIEHYLHLIEAQNICKGDLIFLFLNQQGRPLGRTEVYLTVRSLLKGAGVQGKTSPHVLRHTFATHLLNHGVDIRTIQDLLGHSSLAATQVYTHNSIEQLKAIYHKAHPRAHLNNKEE